MQMPAKPVDILARAHTVDNTTVDEVIKPTLQALTT
jgi:hypothetical protein